MIYTVTFNPALDYVIRTEKFATNQVNRSDTESIYYGGKGINVSIILSRLGIANLALGFIAGFTGREIEQGVKERGVLTDFIWLKEGLSRINVKIKSKENKEETEVNGQGPEIPNTALLQLFDKLERLTGEDMLVLAGSIPKSLPQDIYQQILEQLAPKKIPVVVDATGALLQKVLKYHPFLIKPNNHELGELFHTTLETTDDILLHARKLQEMGARNVLVSMAGNGSILITENQEVHQMGVAKGTVRNSVGAGDSMVAGFIAGYQQTKDYAYALRLGTAAGGATAFSDDLATKEEIETILKQL
ncbi:MAG: 1-phosphofructokinase [Lachnospiraceae bacterium]|nr:1-phosphofructokinase [Lachnospiraceae bacterium]